MQHVTTRHVAIGIAVLGLPSLAAVLVWSVGLLWIGQLQGAAILLLLFAPGLLIYGRMLAKALRAPIKAPPAPWTACIALNAAWAVAFIAATRSVWPAVYPLAFVALSLLGRFLETDQARPDPAVRE